ncbi:MAG TPA: DNA polymerase III subunit delta' [Terriglobales bacterium]|nr:DNA polymerase III subunit delta' [Terriglobales bacterium]
MGFDQFHGNPDTVQRLRAMLGRDRFPHAVILAGPEGSGKYTLAQMVAKAMNCLNSPLARRHDDQPGLGLAVEAPADNGLPDFCGVCRNCTRIAEADDLSARCEEAVETRESLRETDKKETRIFIQTHPEVLIIPPDPPQMMIKVDQVRHVTATIYYKPGEARRRVYIFTAAVFMKEAANALLKVLEEPPEFATIFLLAENPGALLPTIRSRCVTFQLAPLQREEIERLLAQRRSELNPKQRALVAALSGGAVGKALSFDLPLYLEARQDALTLLSTALLAQDHSALFKVTETYRAGAEGKEKTDRLIRTTYGLLRDLLALKSGTAELVRNRDIENELSSMARSAEFAWIATASRRLGEVESGMRRNLLRNLSLDSFVAALEK